ncbi:two-component system, NtrC family, sensor histidine kinase PilS [Polaromonas sp. OV174]|uniref:ATP-binding protein n=1 Tax=Polaromonas sp. OV174 TaxID=1855300 RepID=UPI0008ED578B|nr:ATP-binding protein [Polaromonas sp. OV174]SFC02000.1 two-component system, NtrC family, sensor histidine kinase PilS [Polaromonas sp. OV174]
MNHRINAWLESAEETSGAWERQPEQSSFGRLWRVFMTARIAIAAVLVSLQAAVYALGTSPHGAMAVCTAYLCATLAVKLWARPRPPGRTMDAQWFSTIGVDVIAFSLLNFLQSSGINYTPLFALPVLLSSVLGPILLAFGTAASVTLLLLADAWWRSLHGSGDFNASFLQAGLSGSGFFLVALLANQLALRLAREERRARRGQSAARMQTQVNELVIEALGDGVLVVDVKGTVRSANPAARRLLATNHAAPFLLTAQAAWQPLVELIHRTFITLSPQQADISLEDPARNARRLQVRTRLAASQDGTHENRCVMFLEDLREMEARVRLEKMAAMGRMSAAVAHEIRNPLAAISQANALLEEDLIDTGQRQLTTMVRQNAQRLAKIVDEVLDISRAQAQIPAPQTTLLVLDEAVARITADWIGQNAASERIRLITGASQAAVYFDFEHLRRLMINLLDNALRYTSDSSHAIEISTQLVAAGQARLAVWSDGQPLESTVQTHLFEPFFSSESRSSGLGLYICRELCERYGALIGYQRALRAATEGNEFFVIFRPASHSLNPGQYSFDSVLV